MRTAIDCPHRDRTHALAHEPGARTSPMNPVRVRRNHAERTSPGEPCVPRHRA
jgi:hypothetical protein